MERDRTNDAKGQAYLASLGVVAVLLIGFLDKMTGGWGITNPAWLGLLANWFYSIGWYMLFGSIIQIITTFACNYLYDMPLQAVLPTIMVFSSLLLYLFEQAITEYYTYAGPPLYNVTNDSLDYPPRNLWIPLYLAETIPLYLVLIFIVSYAISMCSYGIRKKKRFLPIALRAPVEPEQRIARDPPHTRVYKSRNDIRR